MMVEKLIIQMEYNKNRHCRLIRVLNTVIVKAFESAMQAYCTVLYCTTLYCTVLHCTVLYYTVLYCTVLYCTVPATCVPCPSPSVLFDGLSGLWLYASNKFLTVRTCIPGSRANSMCDVSRPVSITKTSTSLPEKK